MSKFAEKVKRYYERGDWTEKMVRDAYAKRRITEAELAEILGEDPDDETAPKHMA